MNGNFKPLYIMDQILLSIRPFRSFKGMPFFMAFLGLSCCVYAESKPASPEAPQAVSTAAVESVAVAPEAEKAISEEHAKHLELNAKVATLETELMSTASESSQNQQALAMARKAALEHEEVAKRVREIETLRMQLDAAMNSDTQIVAMLEMKQALKSEISELTSSRQALMQKMQLEGISDEARESVAAMASRASEAQGQLARLSIEIESKQAGVRAEDEAAKALHATIVEKEHLMQAAVSGVSEVAALEAQRSALQARTRDVMQQRVELLKQVKAQSCCPKPDPTTN